jgi:hypothetical protein
MLLQQGRFAEARTAMARGLALIPERDPLRPIAAQQLQEVERLSALERRLSAVLRGEAEPAGAGEQLALGQLCQQVRQRYATAARFYAGAFAADPRLAADLRSGYRYDAACNAALAAAGRAADAKNLPDKAQLMLRRQALGWLRADLVLYAMLARREEPAAKRFVRERLANWQRDGDVASVRDKEALDRLPDDERKEWGRLWDEVAALLKQVGDKK